MTVLHGIHTSLWPEDVRVTDVGPRDGLQNESYILPTDQKIRLIEGLAEAGVGRIQVTSFVSPTAVPQMADAAQVVAGIERRDGVRYIALVPNEHGYECARRAGLDEVSLVLSATETMNRKNLNMSVAESMSVAERLLERAGDDGVTVRVDVSVAFVCAYEGDVDRRQVASQTCRLFDMGADEVCLCDTTGHADPRHVAELFAMVRDKRADASLAGHFHDTYGMALANTVAAMQQGVSAFDTAVGGLGGCPYSPGASGNASTEDLVSMLHGMGVETSIDLERLCDVTDFVKEFSGRVPSSAYYRATREAAHVD